MSRPVLAEKPKGEWKPNDPRLLRAAQRLIRLYDGEQAGPFWIKPESIANVIADELNNLPEKND
jgi:hypothetical protein